MQTIKHDLEGLISELNTLEKVRLPYAAKRALYELGPYLRNFHAREMAGTFKNTVPFTLRSVRYRVEPNALRLTLSISDDGTLGQTPANYLEPVFRQQGSTRGTAVTTRFARQLQRAGLFTPGSYLVPNPRAKLAQTRRGKISPAQYQKALSYLGGNVYAPRKSQSGERYFAIDSSSTSALKPGLYRAKGDTISQLFALLDSPPSVARTYDWTDASIDEAIDQLEGRIMKHIRWS